MKMDFTFEPTHTNKINTKIQTQRAIQIARYGWRESEREKCENVTKRDTFFGRFGICEMSQSVKIDLSFWLICKWQRKPYRKSNLPWIRTNREEKNGNQRWWSGLAFDASASANFQSQFHIATVILYTAKYTLFCSSPFFAIHHSIHPFIVHTLLWISLSHFMPLNHIYIEFSIIFYSIFTSIPFLFVHSSVPRWTQKNVMVRDEVAKNHVGIEIRPEVVTNNRTTAKQI